jgi:tetratricopeptide (TPR) repeat protein
MKKKSFLDKFGGLFSSTAQLQRIVILSGVVLVLLAGTFGAYYYYDRYYQPQGISADIAITQAEKDVDSDPSSVEKRLVLADKYMQAGRWDDALSQLAQAQLGNPDEPQQSLINLNSGVSFHQSGKFEEAIDPLTKYVAVYKDEDMPGLDKKLQAAAYYLGDSYINLGKYEEAVTALELCVGWSRTDADALYKLGIAYMNLGENEKAIENITIATDFDPNFVEGFKALAEIYTSLGQDALSNYANGMVMYGNKEYDQALQLLLDSTQQKPDFSRSQLALGLTYEALGEFENARDAYKKSLSIDPSGFSANSGYKRIELLLQK